MMKKNTRIALNRLAETYKGHTMDWEDWERVIKWDRAENTISFSTFRKYANLEKVTVKTEYTLEETLELLNNCAGNDCYDTNWNFITENGKIYNVETMYTWK